MTAENVLREIKENYYSKMVEDRRAIHGFAEQGMDLPLTCNYVRAELRAVGIEPADCGKGITAVIGKGERTFLLRADMDALPIKEETGLEFASKSGRMHACGHDIHTAMLLCAARYLKAHEDELKGRVKLMFQPGEEILAGAKDMIDKGILDEPKVDAAAMIHVVVGVELRTGSIAITSPGDALPAADYFEIDVRGKACHGSMPFTGIDPITAASHIVINLQEIGARELSPKDDFVLTFGQLHGGKADNAIPDNVKLGGTLRAYNERTREHIKERLTEIAEDTAKVFRAEAEVNFTRGCPGLYSDPELVKKSERYLKELMGDRAFVLENSVGGGSEDFAYVSRLVPSVMLNLGAGSRDEGYSYPMHHPMVTFDEGAMVTGAAAFVWLAAEYLKES